MGLVSLQEDIIDGRIANGARIICEGQYPRRDFKLDPQANSSSATTAEAFGMTPAELIDLRKWAQRVTKECRERLSREMTLVYTLNEQRARVLAIQYMSKGEAAKMTKVVPGGDLLALDCVYGGMLVRDGYVFVSEQALAEGLCKYGPEELLNGLIEERMAA